MENAQLKAALVQLLENFQRCGVSRFARRRADELPAPLLARIAELKWEERTREEVMRERDDGAAGRLAPHRYNKDGEDRAREGVALERDDDAAGGLAPLRYSLPVLEIDERQRRFDALAGQIRDCRRCGDIVSFRQQTVFGDGTLKPTICFMGEAPGADEDRLGKPFVGKAGQLLTKIIEAMKLRREEVYILNALKCRPPQNRTPMDEEIENCRSFVEAQLEILQPKFIVCLGAVAVRSILQSNQSIGRLRGQFYSYRNSRVLVTYHPSYLLRNESAKKLVWDDMKMLMAAISRER